MPYLKITRKYVNHRTYPLTSADISIISAETSIYYIERVFKGCFNQHDWNFYDAIKISYCKFKKKCFEIKAMAS